MQNQFIDEESESVETAKSNLRILVVDNWSFQLMETLSKLGQAGYFNSSPALNCLEALITLMSTRRPFDVILFSANLNEVELNMLILEIAKKKLARYFLLIGETHSTNYCQDIIYETNTPEFRCLGILSKPLSTAKLANTLARIPVRNGQKTNIPVLGLPIEARTPPKTATIDKKKDPPQHKNRHKQNKEL
ncbi:hypothetical protein [Pseudomonas sp. GM17]|uniref:hypothetical protein n=1 Tax=Pseudomonas sp. GM17 TaxID=1144323 RepID=UPI0002727258|nr:hypothetical protein [Pseudomonas sp. GM17]WIE49836.1 hypothetical protein PMI20_029740 [Pseudomonas sp. GM17]